MGAMAASCVGLLPYDALFTARLAELLLEEWGEAREERLHMAFPVVEGGTTSTNTPEAQDTWWMPLQKLKQRRTGLI